MPDLLYNKPLNFSQIFSNKDLATTSQGKSISQQIELLIFTRFGEHRHDHNFGCEIWDLDFELVVNEKIWEEKFRISLLRSITNYEHRIYEVEVEIRMTEVERIFSRVVEIKKQVDIFVRAKIAATGESYSFNTVLYLSPLSS
jgi:phage baseplate assembly protein W